MIIVKSLWIGLLKWLEITMRPARTQRAVWDEMRLHSEGFFGYDWNYLVFLHARLLVIPRCLRDVSQIDCQTDWLNTVVKIPIGVAPSAFQKMAHPQGELATIRGASQAGALMILSSWSTTAVGEVTNEASRYGGHVWFQVNLKLSLFAENLFNLAVCLQR